MWVSISLYSQTVGFLLHNTMHQCSLCHYVVSVCLSRSCIVSKRVQCTHILKIFYCSSFSTPSICQYSDRNPLTGVKIAVFNQCPALGSMTFGASSVINILDHGVRLYNEVVVFVYRSRWVMKCQTSVNLVYDSKALQVHRREQNRI